MELTPKELKELLKLHKLFLKSIYTKGQRLNLSGYDLRHPDIIRLLKRANLNNANLSGANLNGATNISHIRISCPDTGSFIGWKKVNGYIVKLKIPARAKRCSATSNKCRCEYAKVLAIQNIDGSKARINEVFNNKYATCNYKIGEIVYPDSFDENRWKECSNGIHFFINRQDAVKY